MNRSKDVYFIRHAESKENANVQNFCKAVQQITNLQLPTYNQVFNSSKLLHMETDAKLSSLGRRQLLDMSMILREKNFWDKISSVSPTEGSDKTDNSNIIPQKFAIVFSPLIRANNTCFSIVPETFHEYCVELECLRETTPYEHIIPFSVVERTKAFQLWLQSTDAEIIIVFGHSRYFKRLLKLKTVMRNCDVWFCKARMDSNPTKFTPITWERPVLLHRTELAERSLFAVLFANPFEDPFAVEEDSVEENRSSRVGDHDSNATDNAPSSSAAGAPSTSDSEIFCRICQATQSEEPEMKLIQPCRCTGTLSYVHIQCLNTWRATSSTAFSTCSVCNFEYEVEHSFWADLLQMDEVVMLLTGIAMLLIVVTVGFTALRLAQNSPSWAIFLQQLYTAVDLKWPPHFCRFDPYASTPWDDMARRSSKSGWVAAVWNLWVRGTGYWRLMRSPLTYYHMLCQEWLLAVVHALLLGMVFIGISSFAWNLVIDLQLVVFRGGNAPHYVLSLLSWLLQGNNTGFRRFMVIIGCVMSMRELHDTIFQYSRRLVQWIGEKIVERPLQ